jgi:hypothetical protein
MRAVAEVVVVALLLALVAAPARAQDPEEDAPAEGQIVALRLRQPAPFAGLLLEQEDLVRWRLEIESLRYRLTADHERAAAELQVHLDLGEQRLVAERARRALVEELWTQRAAELRGALDEALRRAERGPWEQPVLWLVIGLAVGAAAVAVAIAVGSAG